MSKQTNITGYILMSPYLVFTLLFFSYPFVWGLWLVLNKCSIISSVQEFVGLENFRQAFQSVKTLAAFLFTYKFAVIFIPLTIVSAFFIALLINSIGKGKTIFAIGFFLPHLASGVSLALITRGIISWNSPVSEILKKIIGFKPDWFGTPGLAVLIIGLMAWWRNYGYYTLIFLAGLQSIPKELYESAQIDGAGFWCKTWNVTIPMLYPTFYTTIILTAGLSFEVFAEPFMLTGGGPRFATHSWHLEIYRETFTFWNAGYGATIALLNAAATFATVLLLRFLLNKWGKAHGWIK